MSHFTVAVITDDIRKVEELLEPYQENNMENVDRKYLEFYSITKQEKEKWKKESTIRIMMPNGNLLKKYDEKFAIKKRENKMVTTTYEIPNNCKEVKIPYKVLFKTFEDYMNYMNNEKDEEMNDYGYWENPNARWDWFCIGGRFENYLLTKKDNVDVIENDEEKDHVIKKIPEGYKWVNAAKIKDIDFEKMQEISNDYKKAIRFWEMYIDGKEPETEEEKEQIKWTYYTKKYYIEKYKNKECYAEIEGTFSTWALLDDTGWYEQGKMGLFAMNDSTAKSELEFVKKFQETINKPENQNKYLVIVDCHI